MEKLKLKDGTLFDMVYAESGEILGTGEKTVQIAIVLEDGKNPVEIEDVFKNKNADRLEIGYMQQPILEGTEEEPEQQEETFILSRIFEGYSEIKTYTVDRNYPYDNQTGPVMHIVLQEPDIRSTMQESDDAIMLALCEVYEMLIGG